MAVAGRVLMIPAGTWTSGTNYGMLDVVIYAGSSYVAKKQINNSTVAPPNATSDWQLLAQGFDVTNVVTKSMIVNNFLATDPNTVLSGPMGKSLKDQFDILNSNLANRMQLIKFAASTDGNGTNAWLGIDIVASGVTGKKLKTYPAIVASISECSDSTFAITNLKRTNDTYITVLFNKPLASGFYVNLWFLVE